MNLIRNVYRWRLCRARSYSGILCAFFILFLFSFLKWNPQVKNYSFENRPSFTNDFLPFHLDASLTAVNIYLSISYHYHKRLTASHTFIHLMWNSIWMAMPGSQLVEQEPTAARQAGHQSTRKQSNYRNAKFSSISSQRKQRNNKTFDWKTKIHHVLIKS